MNKVQISKTDPVYKYIYKIITGRRVSRFAIDIYDPRRTDQNGQAKRNRSQFNSIEAAIREVNEIQKHKALYRGGFQIKQKGTLTFHQLIREASQNHYENFINRHKDEDKNYLDTLWASYPGPFYNKVLKDFKNVPLEIISYESLTRYTKGIIQKYSVSYHNKMVVILKTIFNYAVHVKEALEKDPSFLLKPERETIDPEYRKPLPSDEITRIISHFKNNRSLPAWLLAINNGLRHQDILHIEVKNINFEDGYILLPHTKTRGTDPVAKVTPLTSYMCNLLKGFISEGQKYLFERNGKRILNLKWYRKRAKHELNTNSDFGFHQLRHTFASNLANNNVSGEVISFLLFHSNGTANSRITRRYIHLELKNRIKTALSYKNLLEKIEIKINT